MASAQSQCEALQLSDEQRCQNEATHANGLFCKFHAKQVYGLYKGYKRRNARLDALEKEAPTYLKNARTPLANETFEEIEDEETLREIHNHLFEKYVTIGKVIDARKLHHKHFYSLHFDYGHQAYLDKLSNERHIVLRTLERLDRRTAAVVFKKEKWYSWVKKTQDEEEENREKEQKKVKQEAALFRRHMKQLQARMALTREKEEKKRQDAYLEDAHRERMSLSADEAEDDMEWDPIEDLEDDKRNRYIDLIKHFLWMDDPEADKDAPEPMDVDKPGSTESSEAPAKKPKKKAKARQGPAAAKRSAGGATSSRRGQSRILDMQDRDEDEEPDLQEPDKKNIETVQEMRKRLSEGVKKNFEDVWGFQIVGTLENPHETHDRTAPLTQDEIDSLVKDIQEVKLLLFCRLLLTQASMLPAAIKANSVEEFLSDAQVAESDLRDLCLKVEEPTLQLIRDACADFARGDRPVTDTPAPAEEEDDDEDFMEMLSDDRRYSHLHSRNWLYDWLMAKHDKQMKRKKLKPKSRKKTKVTICGKTIWNHASEQAMSRDGWLQFSVMAKDCDLKHAIQLCRNWNEFSDLNLLTLWQYFPASNWVSWGSNRMIQQLQELGFYPYFMDFDAQQYSRNMQVGGRSQGRRAHDIVETRNILVGHLKRNDPITRRFLQYLQMRTGEVLIMVRDGKTGRVITAPPDQHLWTYRKKQGFGRATKAEWKNVLEVGPKYFAMTDLLREWRFRFNDYYDVFIWDFVPGQSAIEMYNVIIAELRNAWRIKHPRDGYQHMKPLLQTLHREPDTMRTRQIKPGEKVVSLWDTVMDERNEFKLFDVSGQDVNCRDASELTESPYMFYNAANEAEDAVLFPDDTTSNKKSTPFREIRNGVASIEGGVLPSTIRHLAKGMEALEMGKDPMDALEFAMDNDEDSIWALPKVWETGLRHVRREKPVGERRKLLSRTGMLAKEHHLSIDERLEITDPMEVMERDRSFGFKESFHAGDLEPGCREKFLEVQDVVKDMLKLVHTGPTDWVWFIAEILDWMQIRTDYDDYAQEPLTPWPHGFITQDIVQAFAQMAMFFPDSKATTQVTMFLSSDKRKPFKESLLFDPKERSKTTPDRRTRTSYKFRDKAFWKEWKEFLKTKRYFADVYPLDWSIAIRPIVAHLYKSGLIAPAYYQNDPQVVSGMATAKAEPHRPGKLDLFINYEDRYGGFPMQFPPNFITPDQWPILLPHARKFSESNPGARFALLRLWSAPHYYPLMVGLQNRQGASFLDSCGRSWEWKFVPKDMPGSEFSIHRTVANRLEMLEDQLEGRVVNRGDLILVMGQDSDDLLKYCTAVTFALQTKPWLREVDLWKSFINVGIDFLEDADPWVLD